MLSACADLILSDTMNSIVLIMSIRDRHIRMVTVNLTHMINAGSDI